MTAPEADGPKRTHVGRTIRKEIEIDATPDEVFRAWADPKRIAQWFVDRAEGEAKTGSVMKWIFDTFGHEQLVPILKAEPGREIVIGGEIPGRPPFLQEVQIESKGGRTVLRVLQSGFGDGSEWDDEYEGIDSGWEMAIATLGHWLETYGTDDRTHLVHMQPAKFEYEPLQRFFDSAAGLERWLAEKAELSSPLRVGSAVRLNLGDLGSLNGEVVARTAREVLLSWPEQHALLTLKCFSMGPRGRMLALDFNAWPLAPERRSAIQEFLQQSVAKLVVATETELR